MTQRHLRQAKFIFTTKIVPSPNMTLEAAVTRQINWKKLPCQALKYGKPAHPKLAKAPTPNDPISHPHCSGATLGLLVAQKRKMEAMGLDNKINWSPLIAQRILWSKLDSLLRFSYYFLFLAYLDSFEVGKPSLATSSIPHLFPKRVK